MTKKRAKNKVIVEPATAKAVTTAPRGDAAKQNKERPARVSMSSGSKLKAPKREGYQRYWSISGPNHPGEIDQMLMAWWDYCLDENGDQIKQLAGGGDIHYLMEIEQKYYDEDIQKQQDRNLDATQKNIQSLSDSEYVPNGHAAVVTRDII